jgi:hypothetical protein
MWRLAANQAAYAMHTPSIEWCWWPSVFLTYSMRVRALHMESRQKDCVARTVFVPPFRPSRFTSQASRPGPRSAHRGARNTGETALRGRVFDIKGDNR